jgi:hypothetical protein
MKTTKAEAILLMRDELDEHAFLNKMDFLAKVDISSLTFNRYMSELRCYLANFRPDEQVIYRKSDGLYHLLKN